MQQMIKWLFILLPIALNAQSAHFEFETYTSKQGSQFYAPPALVGMTKGSYCDYANTLTDGAYTLFVRYATTQNGVRMTINQGASIDTVNMPNTGAWNNYTTLTKTIYLAVGPVCRWQLVSDPSVNLDWFELRRDSTYTDIPAVSDTIFCLAVSYRSGNLVLTKDTKYLIGKRDPLTGRMWYYDDKKNKLNAIQFEHPIYGWRGL